MSRASKDPMPIRHASANGLVLEAGRPPEVVAFDEKLVAFFVDAADLLGVPKSVAAIYGVVFASPQPLSFAEIEARLDVSKGSISQGLRVLREVGALKEVSSAAERSERFAPEMEMRKLVAQFIESRMEKQLTAGSERLEFLRGAVPNVSVANSMELKRRLKSLSNWHRKARGLLPLIRGVLRVTV